MILFRSTPFYRGLAALTAMLGLSACGLLPSQDNPANLSQFASNNELANWQLKGKIGIKSAQQSGSAYIHWRQCEQQFEITLNGPLGTGTTKILGSDKLVTLQQSDQPPISASDAKQLLEQQLGWPIPLSELRYWATGLAAPNAAPPQLAQDNTGFKQLEWALQFKSSQPFDNYLLPTKTIAERPGIKVTLLSREWNLNPQCKAN